ncbi:MAG TPA: hypothetical protein VGE77_06750 [Nocardioides sp.]
MNDRRRVRLFLDHKPPLLAFAVVSIACALMMVHVARSEASPGWLRAGLSGVVAQKIAEATVLEPDPAPERRTEAAGPLADGPRAPAAAPSHDAPDDSGSRGPSREAGSVEVGVVAPSGDEHAGSTRDDEPEAPGDAAVVDGDPTGPGHGHRGPQAVSDVPVPGASPGRGPRGSHGPHDWRDDWVGDRGHDHDHDHGRGHDGDRGHGPKSSTPPGHGEHGHGEHGHGEHGHGEHGHDRGEHGRGGHGHGKHGSVHGHGHH